MIFWGFLVFASVFMSLVFQPNEDKKEINGVLELKNGYSEKCYQNGDCIKYRIYKDRIEVSK